MVNLSKIYQSHRCYGNGTSSGILVFNPEKYSQDVNLPGHLEKLLDVLEFPIAGSFTGCKCCYSNIYLNTYYIECKYIV